MVTFVDVETTMISCDKNINVYIHEYKINDDEQNDKAIKNIVNESIKYLPDEDSPKDLETSKLMKRDRDSVSDFECFIEHIHLVNKVSKKLNESRKDLITISKHCDKNDEHIINETIAVFMNDMVLPDEISSNSNSISVSNMMNSNMNSLNDLLTMTKAKNDLFWSDMFFMEQEAL